MTRCIGFFSGLDPLTGGIAVCGRSAWNGVVGGRDSDLICYGAIGKQGDLLTPGRVVKSQSRFKLIGKLLARSWSAEVCVFWHIDLLKLLPFLRGFRGKVVLNLHGIDAWRTPGRLTKRCLDRVDLFTSISQHTWDQFLTYAPHLSGRRHQTVHLGWGEPLNGPSPVPSTVPSAIIISRLEKAEDYKGHRELILAWREVQNRIPEARLDIVGDGTLRPELEQLTKENGLQEAVRFHGRVSEERKAELLADSRCFAMPSRGEGFGIVYVEAMRLGRPCLVSDCDAGHEVVGTPECGLAVNTSDIAGISQSLIRLLSDGSDWQRLSRAARERYEEQFTERRFHARLHKAISEYVLLHSV
jgi:phosphatidyl-myo-inositol dimannoside synthase